MSEVLQTTPGTSERPCWTATEEGQAAVPELLWHANRSLTSWTPYDYYSVALAETDKDMRVDKLFVAASAFAVAARYGLGRECVKHAGWEMGLSLGKWSKQRIPWTTGLNMHAATTFSRPARDELVFGLFAGTAQIARCEPLSSRLAVLFKHIPRLNVELVARLEAVDADKLSDCDGDVLIVGLRALSFRPARYRVLPSDPLPGYFNNRAPAAAARAALDRVAGRGSEPAIAFASVLAELDTMQRELAENLAAASVLANKFYKPHLQVWGGPLGSAEYSRFAAARAQHEQMLEKKREILDPHCEYLETFAYTARSGNYPADSGIVCEADRPSPTDPAVPVVPESYDHLMALTKIALAMEAFNGCRARAEAAGRSAAAANAACANLAWVAASLD